MHTHTHTRTHTHTHTRTHTHTHTHAHTRTHTHTQSDMADKREVSNGEGELLARQLKCPFFETSAKLRVHIDESFQELVREIKKCQQELSKQTQDKPSEGSCCVLL